MHLNEVFLKRRHEKRVLSGHPWVFSNEIDTKRSPLNQYEAGQGVIVKSNAGHSLGSGYMNPSSLIAVRLLGRTNDLQLDETLLTERLKNALNLRERFFERPYYRLVYAESDQLPGIVVDRYDDLLVVQLTTAGADKAKDSLRKVLIDLLSPRCILVKNDHWARGLEGLSKEDEVLLGEAPDELTVWEGDVRFHAPLGGGQKTGWFYDQRTNRSRVRAYARNARVLDVCTYVGGFAVNAAMAGANEVCLLDTSEAALNFAQRNLEHNAPSTPTVVHRGDMFETLRQLRDEHESFDTIILDPPALIPKRKDETKGQRAYQRLNELALKVLRPGGVLISCSCSFHLSRRALIETLRDAARSDSHTLQLLEQGHQSLDHPIHFAMPETEYLKAIFAHKIG